MPSKSQRKRPSQQTQPRSVKAAGESASSHPKSAPPQVSPATFLSLLALLVLSLVINANNVPNELVYDDYDAIVNNEAAHGLGNTRLIFSTPSWWSASVTYVRHYRPLTTWTYALNYSLHGLKPDGYHLANNVLHGLVAWLVYLVLASSGVEIGAAFIAAVLFLTHPIHVEAVAWANCRADILAGGFILLALLCHIHAIAATGKRRTALLAGGLVSAVLAGLAKETGFMAPFVVLAWDFLLRDNASLRRAWTRLRSDAGMEYGLYLLVLVGLVWSRAHLVGGATEATVSKMASPLGGAGFVDRLLTGSYVMARYVGLLLWPAKLSVDYSPDQITRVSSLADPRAWLGLGVLVACGVGIVVTARRSPIVCFALVTALVVFAPASNIPFAIGTIMAERLMYLPALALCVPLALGLWSLRRWTKSHALGVSLAVGLALAYSARTWVRNRDWRNEETLFRAALAASPRSAMSHKNLAAVLQKEGRNEEAIPLAEQAIRILDEFPDAHYVLGNCYFMTQRHAEAVKQFQATLALVPDHASAHMNLGATYHVMGRYAQALQEFDAAIKLDPGMALAWFNRVHTLVALGRLDEAERALDEAMRRFPNSAGEADARAKIDAARQAQATRSR